ncbi:MAG: cysteine desulfurase [Clostridia bacterium]|nr:cysteine desulfurase [Clostridia bacterium]
MTDKTPFVYLDNSATTALCPEAEGAIQQAIACYGNPSSLHAMGQTARKTVETARKQLLSALDVRLPDTRRVIFTSCGTEANNMAVYGVIRAKKFRFLPRIVTTDSEHPSILEPLRDLESRGEAEVIRLSTKGGRIDLAELDAALNERTVLLSIMLVNNETGAVYDVASAFHLAKRKLPTILTHTDLTQGFLKVLPKGGYDKLGADLITVSGHKIHAPKGVGALIVSADLLRSKRLVPYLYGGGQEGGLRSGTENVMGIAALGAAAKAGKSTASDDIARMTVLHSTFVNALPDTVRVNAPAVCAAPHIISLTLPRIKSQSALNALSAKGICVSSGSACSSHGGHGSYVLLAYGLPPEEADCTLRVSLSRYTTEHELLTAAEAIREVCDTMIHIK